MTDDSRNREALEALWRRRWDEAKRNLELAAIHVKQIEQQKLSGDAYRHALEAEVLAAVEYTRVLRFYTDLVVHGKSRGEAAEARITNAGAGVEE